MSAQNQLPFSQVKQKISQAKSILMLLPQLHSVDSVASGLALYLTLKDAYAKNGKSISIVSSGDITVAYQRLYGVGSISKKTGSKNLLISLDTTYENVEKVASDNEDGKFNLSIEMKEGLKRLTDKDVSFSYRGVDADLIITIGINNSNQIGDLMTQETSLFVDRESVAFAANGQGLNLGSVKVYEPQASSVAELIVRYLRFAKVRINPDIATNLLAGIEASTSNLTQKATAETFASIAWCMRVGGKRNHLDTQATSPAAPAPGAFGMPGMPPAMPAPTQAPVVPIQSQSSPDQVPAVPPAPFQPEPKEAAQDQAPQQASPEPTQNQDQKADGKQEAPKEDWYEPKIYRGGQV